MGILNETSTKKEKLSKEHKVLINNLFIYTTEKFN